MKNMGSLAALITGIFNFEDESPSGNIRNSTCTALGIKGRLSVRVPLSSILRKEVGLNEGMTPTTSEEGRYTRFKGE